MVVSAESGALLVIETRQKPVSSSVKWLFELVENL